MHLLFKMAFILSWFFSSVGALAYLWTYETMACPKGITPTQWSNQGLLKRENNKPIMIMTLHPKCPCSDSSLEELAWILTHSLQSIDTYILFIRPSMAEAGWEKSKYWKKAKELPGVYVMTDIDGNESRRLGGTTSGHVIFYNNQGQLLFSGGITGARSQVGNNPARQALLEIINHKRNQTIMTSVYGCALETPANRKKSFQKKMGLTTWF